MHASERFGDGDLLGEDEGVHEILQFARIIISSGKIAHLFDRNSAVHVKISWDYESFVADEIVHGFDESRFCLEISLKNMNFYVIILYILFEELAELGDELHLLHHKIIVGLEDVYGSGLGNHSLEY